MKYHIENDLTKLVKDSKRLVDLTPEEHVRLYAEIKNATLQGIDRKLEELSMNIISGDAEKIENKVQSLLLWVLKITDDKPTSSQKIKNPGSYADIDIDYPKHKRERVFEYLYEKYGRDRVAHVGTFGTLGGSSSVRNATRALGFDTTMQNKLAKMLSKDPNATLQDSINASKELQAVIKKDKDAARVIEIALQLEGLPNSIGVHASACVISDEPLTSYVPLMISARKDSSEVMTQFEYYDVEALGIIKHDILGIESLDEIEYTLELIKDRHGIDIDIDSIDVNDPKIYELLLDGHNTNIFQFVSDMFANAIQKVRPQNIDEISDITSLMRPGPMGMGLPERYVEAKFEDKKYDYGIKDKKLVEKLWEICSRSYGLLVYQEQLIKCFTELGDFNEIEADNARRATGKKDAKLLQSLGATFIERAVKKGYSEEGIRNLFDQMADFSSYSFNASHAVCYSHITCMTAWLSLYYPLEYFTASLTLESDDADAVRKYIKAVKDRGYGISAPDINSSDLGFVISDKSITFGLAGIKGVGAAVSKKIIKRRPKSGYKSLGHFINRNPDVINAKVLDSYAKAGAFKSLGVNKATALDSIQPILDFVSVYKDAYRYHTIFELCKIPVDKFIDETILQKNDAEDNLYYEIESLGLYITKHPMDDYIVNPDRATDIRRLDEFYSDDPFITVGAISGVEVRKTKAKTNMCSFNITTSTHSAKCMVFAQAYAKLMDEIKEGRLVVVAGKIKEEEAGKLIVVNDISGKTHMHLMKTTKKKTTPVLNLKDINATSPDLIEVVINKYLKYLLER